MFLLLKNQMILILFILHRGSSSNHRDRQIEIDLLYLERDGDTHYCLIKDLNSLFSNNGNRAYACRNCITIFTSVEALTVVVKWGFWLMLHSMTPLQGCIKEILSISLKKISLHSMTPPSEQLKENI